MRIDRNFTALLYRLLAAVLVSVALPAGTPLAAQTTTGSIRGYIRADNGEPIVAAEVRARNTASGNLRVATTNAKGFFALSGLVPGPYSIEVRRIGFKPSGRSERVQIGEDLALDFILVASAVQLEEITVSGLAASETRSTEVATNVTQTQIDNLPKSDRNFLNLAALAPGVKTQGDRINDTRKTITSGAQGAEQINVFIDGASYKNDILRGGVAGQDASRGNPFPLNAVQEFRIITQNYKAEYQKASSAIISATTRSGGNVWSGSSFFSYQNKGLVALDTFQIADKGANPATFVKPDYKRSLVGVSLGGPVIKNKMQFFGSYEGNYQDRSNRVAITPPTGTALNPQSFTALNGAFNSPFRSSLFFGKLSYSASNNSSLELSLNTRNEHDIRDFGGNTAFSSATLFKNSVTTGILKHNWYKGAWLNEAMLSYQNYHYNPVPNDPGAVNQFYFGFPSGAVQVGTNVSEQDFKQKRLSLRDDITYSGFQVGGSHVFKVGANVDFAKYDIIKQNSETPRFVYEGWWQNYAIPQHVEFQAGDPNFSTKNTQVGAYAQDDWSPTSRLTLYLGVRWDYESGMINTDFVTPQKIRDSLTKYQNLLFVPLDPARYFSTGSNRKAFMGAFQPRGGFSYALDKNNMTTVFGSLGLFYDRTLFDQALEEKFAPQHPSYRIEFYPTGGPAEPNKIEWQPSYLTQGKAVVQTFLAGAGANTAEIKLLPNDLKPPKSTQFAAGIRHLFNDVAVELAYNGVRSSNTFTFYFVNMNFTCPQRSFGVAGCFVENRVPGFGTVLFADNAGKTWYDAATLKVDRVYRSGEKFGWGGGLAYTFAKRQTQGFNDDFSFPNPADYPKQVRNDERHRVVANWVIGMPSLLNIFFSGIATIGSGTNYDVGDRFGGTGNPLKPGGFNGPTYKMLDLRLRKDFGFGRSRFGLSVDGFNVFNSQNLGCFNTGNPADANFGKAGCTISDPRRVQFGLEVGF